MKVHIQIPTVLRRFADNQETAEVEGNTVNEAMAALILQYPALKTHLLDGDGKLRSFVNVFLGADDVRHLNHKYETVLSEGSLLTIIPSIAGGLNDELPSLTPAEIKRYSRHLILPEVGMAGQRKLKAASVLVIGAGGLGSPLLAYLAAAGIGRIGLVDSDVVDETNLQRQIIHGTNRLGKSKLESARSFIENLNPNVRLDLWDTYFNSENAMDIAQDYDILIDGTDNFPTRYLVNDVAHLSRKPNVYGSIFRFEGQASVFCAHDGPCYRCLYAEPPPGLVPSCAEGGVLGVLPGIIGTIQANEAIKIILGIGDTLSGRLLHFDALKMSFREFALRRNPDCPLCGKHPSITEPVDYLEFCGIPAGSPAATVDQRFRITPIELSKRLRNGNGSRPKILDVRNPEELAICRIENSLLIPLAELDYRMHEITRDRDVVILCHSGSRSARAWHLLRNAGFDRIFNLEGGIMRWADDVEPNLNRY